MYEEKIKVTNFQTLYRGKNSYFNKCQKGDYLLVTEHDVEVSNVCIVVMRTFHCEYYMMDNSWKTPVTSNESHLKLIGYYWLLKDEETGKIIRFGGKQFGKKIEEGFAENESLFTDDEIIVQKKIMLNYYNSNFIGDEHNGVYSKFCYKKDGSLYIVDGIKGNVIKCRDQFYERKKQDTNFKTKQRPYLPPYYISNLHSYYSPRVQLKIIQMLYTFKKFDVPAIMKRLILSYVCVN